MAIALSRLSVGKRNYLAHILDGGLYVGAGALLNPQTVLATLVASLHGPTWLVAMLPTLTLIGFNGPALLLAHRVDRMVRVKGFVGTFGIVQRLPVPLLAVALCCLDAERHRVLLVILVGMVPLVSGLAGGTAIGGYMELVRRTVVPERRASAMALRFLLGSLLGLAAGGLIESILERLPGLPGYALLAALASVLLWISFACFCGIREPAEPAAAARPAKGFIDNVRGIPALLRAAPVYRRYLLVDFLRLGYHIPLPFAALIALERTGLEHAFVGRLLAMNMIGAVIGNMIAGWVGDRYGCRRPAQAGLLLAAGTYVVAPGLSSAAAFQVVFLFLGVAQHLINVSMNALSYEIVPEQARATGFAVIKLVIMLGMLVASGLAWLGAELSGGWDGGCVVAALLLVIGAYLLTSRRGPAVPVGNGTRSA